jgi:hypothetical protein
VAASALLGRLTARRAFVCCAASCAALLGAEPLRAQEAFLPPDVRRELVASRAVGSIAVDGRLDESSWFGAGVASGFVQVEPRQGDPAVDQTEVRVLF